MDILKLICENRSFTGNMCNVHIGILNSQIYIWLYMFVLNYFQRTAFYMVVVLSYITPWNVKNAFENTEISSLN